MKKLFVPKVRMDEPGNMKAVSGWMDGLPGKEVLDVVNWKAFPYCPKTIFSVAHSERHLFLKYWVKEDGVISCAQRPNGPVWKDSCVELFIGPGPNSPYCNFEFNLSGFGLAGRGYGRAGRSLLAPERHAEIPRLASFPAKPIFFPLAGEREWELTAVIPIRLFAPTDATSLSGKTYRGNFYKCAELSGKPHFVTWNPIRLEEPDFHRPDFFGEIEFE